MSKRETTLANSVSLAEGKAQYDASCKRILSERRILAEIMKGCVAEFKDSTVEEIVNEYMKGTPEVSNTNAVIDSRIDGIGQEDSLVEHAGIVYDIRYTTLAPGTNAPVKLIMNVEAQNHYYPGYPIVTRGIYYAGRMLSGQEGTEFLANDYANVKKVYSIWICMNPPKKKRNTITRYAVMEECVEGNDKASIEHYDLITTVIIHLGGVHSDTKVRILRLLNILLSDEITVEEKKELLERECKIPMTYEIEREVETMCNLSQGIEERGIRKGKKLGIEIGEKRGVEIGEKRGRAEDIRNLMKNIGVTLEEAMKILEIPTEDHVSYSELI